MNLFEGFFFFIGWKAGKSNALPMSSATFFVSAKKSALAPSISIAEFTSQLHINMDINISLAYQLPNLRSGLLRQRAAEKKVFF